MIAQPLTILDHHYQELNNGGEDVIQGLIQNPKILSPKYFYDDPGSQLFEKICELPEYYPTRTEAWILQQYADEIAEITNCCELIELGSGSSTKTQALLTAYQKIATSCRYLPIDVSGGILKTSVLQLQKKYPDFSIHGLLGTYEQALVHLQSNYLQSRMLFFLGSSLGNFNPEECDSFLNQVSRTLQTGDFFLLGIDLQKPQDILEAAYNDSQEVTAAFNLNMLSHLNWRFQGNFDISLFRHQAIYNHVDNQIEMYLHCMMSHCVSLEVLDLKVDFKAGESILTEISRKFDLRTMETQLQSKGLNTVKTWTDEKGWFGLILCQV
ncbi:MAG: methyltransferase [Aphanizomenon flos-aquae MDT14a]|jgi:dimethylhistidine N-methyltransferase|uniref:Methyltransferase n=1 Tax=Aphanizomenon flos-aquae LD13 TaxID=1710894 RepID=A0A1B7W0S4_APHFL|nr:L-histidine N(alpha)-methyltransferase [Aphanizomenon flos-aquae UKL13-PB]MBO1061357.1 L-histidine N(alpha)-methyltransferase [Aphanizomenon flos-aquae CP01]OBQ26881.1 MAG: methyltransferase [Aphanizomenon flos-aquae LD13]OBQ28470.1 MAG: methyltransferase [Aphanizomenon flos-aquae MDT14a]HCQ20222.1 L-histidine N(alpha)-methyltransferase [Anabaena sp. UBA12330]